MQYPSFTMYALKQNHKIIQITGSEFKIGRLQRNNIVIAESRVSRLHAVIVFHEGKPFIKDISNNDWGVFIGPHKIPRNREVELKIGDFINMGSEKPTDSNCILELVAIGSNEPDTCDTNEFPATQPFPCPSTSRGIPTIDITGGGDFDIIEIPDENHGKTESRMGRENYPSPIHGEPPPESTPIAPSKGKSRIFEIPNESPIQSPSLNAPIATTPKATKQRRPVITISDEEDNQTDDLIGIKKELGPVSNTNSSYVVSERTPIVNDILNTNGLVDVTSTVNGLLKPLPVQNSKHFQTPDTFVKPEPPAAPRKKELNYSMADEVISLESDDEDFPCSQSQFNATATDDVPDYSDVFGGMYAIKPELQHYDEDDDVKFISNSDSWFEPFSQTIRDLKVESSKNYRKSEPAEVEDILDILQDDEDEPQNNLVTSPEAMEVVPEEPMVEARQEPMEVCELPENRDEPMESNERIEKIFQSPTKEPQPAPSTSFVKVPTKTPIPIIEALPRKPSKRRCSEPPVEHTRTKIKTTSTKPEIKQQRKEKLKKISEKKHSEPSTSKPPSTKEHDAKPKVKVTVQNRGHYLTESHAETAPRSKKSKSKPEEVATSSKSSSPTRSESNDHKVSDSAKDSPARDKKKKSNASSKSANSSHSMKTTVKVNGSSKVTEDGSASNYIPLDHLKDQTPKLPDKVPDTSAQTTPATNYTYVQSSRRESVKSILKVRQNLYVKTNEQTSVHKVVKFRHRIDEKVLSPNNVNERFYAPYKVYDHLIKKSIQEHENTLAHVCKWSVRWLEEQQTQPAPPPVYESPYANGQYPDCVEMFKDSLRNKMYHSLWKTIFGVWNVPGSDVLPYSQVARETDVLEIEAVDGPNRVDNPPALWTMFAKRELISPECPMDIQSGQLTILNFKVVRKPSDPPSRTMVFAYVQSCNRIRHEMGAFEKIMFKIYPKPFSIVLGRAKMKILTYSKTRLRQFQALALIKPSPIIQAICNTNYHDTLQKENIPNLNKELSDKFLDPSQRKAVTSCVSCVCSKKSSVFLIEGSRGTGKSQVIVSFIKELYFTQLRSVLPEKFKILIVSNSDKEADDLLNRILNVNKKGGDLVNILRFFGNCDTTRNNACECTVHQKALDEIKRNINLIDMNEEENNLRAKINSCQLVINSVNAPAAKRREKEKQLMAYRNELDELMAANSKRVEALKYQTAKETVIANADIIITTLPACWGSNFEKHFIPTGDNHGSIYKFDVCIFDDANLFEDSALLVPLILHVPHLIMTGDRIDRPYPDSPFEKVYQAFKTNNKDFLVNLEVQYRMNADVSLWVKEYYNLNITNGPIYVKRIFGLKSFVVIDHLSKINSHFQMKNSYEYQASLCERILQAISQLVTDETVKIGVIVRQNDQVESIKRIISYELQRRVNVIKVDVLDRYLGGEHDIIILCCPLKITNEWLYIAVTRAASSVIICGDFENSQNASCVVSLVENAKKRNAFVSIRTDPKQTSVEKIKMLISG